MATIKKFKNGNVNIKFEKTSDIMDILQDDDMFMNDLYFQYSSQTGRRYIVDNNKMLYYSIDGYRGSYTSNRMEGEMVKLTPEGSVTIKDDEDGNRYYAIEDGEPL